MTTFGDMVYEFGGAPISGRRFSNPWATHYFVDYDNGSASNGGKRPDDAMQTITQAVALATGGDVIYVAPRAYQLGQGFRRYQEDVSVTLGGSGGSGVVATNANISIIGITPCHYPQDFLGVRWKHSTGPHLTVDAPALHLENIGFFGEGASNYIINLRNNGATRTQEGTTGFSAYNCAFKGDVPLYGNGANELQIVKCRFQAKYDGTMGGINLVGSSNQVVRPIIANCDFIGGNANNMSQAGIRGAAPWYSAVIRDIYFSEETDTGEYITITGSSNTGVVANIYCASADIGTDSLVTGGIEVAAAYDDAGLQDNADGGS